MPKRHQVEVIEDYKGFQPTLPAKRIVERLLSGIPDRYLIGLQSVVLTNASGLTGKQKRRKTWSKGRKVAIKDAAGLYHREWQNQPAWIEILVDNMSRDWPVLVRRVPYIQDLFVGDILFHEIGHHIHATQAPEHKEKEGVADKWSSDLARYYGRRKYWYLLPLVWVLVFLLRPLHRRLKRKFEEENRS